MIEKMSWLDLTCSVYIVSFGLDVDAACNHKYTQQLK